MPSGMGQEVSSARHTFGRVPIYYLTHSYRISSLPPVANIASGDTVSFTCLDASNGQITRTSTSASLRALDFSKLDQVNGPVYVTGAEEGDTLQVDVLEIETADWGWTALIPGFGLLADEFGDPQLKIWRIDTENGVACIESTTDPVSTSGLGRLRIPTRPFAGEMGVARGLKGAFSTIPPYNTGVSTFAGNLVLKNIIGINDVLVYRETSIRSI
jgi:acetamidase/formamidase